MADHAIEAEDLRRTYRARTGWLRPRRTEVEAVRGVSFTVGRGELFGLLGPNGAGKTTMIALVVPIVQATLAVYLFRSAGEPHRLLQAAVGAGLMGVWSSVLFGSGGAIHNQRWLGTLEMIMLAPRRPVLVILPITVATGLTGTYALLATLAWGRLLYGIVERRARATATLALA